MTREVGPDDWTGARGRIGREDLAPLVHGRATLCFVCGPPALVEEIPQLLEELGVPRERIKIEEWADARGSSRRHEARRHELVWTDGLRGSGLI